MVEPRLELVRTFLRVPDENPLAVPSDDVPDSNGAVITPGNEGTAPRSKGTNRMVVSFEVELMVWVILNVLLRSLTSIPQKVQKMSTERTSEGSTSVSSAP